MRSIVVPHKTIVRPPKVPIVIEQPGVPAGVVKLSEASNQYIAGPWVQGGSWNCPQTGWYIIRAWGGGGTGGLAMGSSGSALTSAAGGGAGGFARKLVQLISGDDLAITVGAGGAEPWRTTTGQSIDGNAGDATTVKLLARGVDIICNGGGAGHADHLSRSAQTVGAGGTATGGDLNLTGGNGGNMTTAAANAANGGGAGGAVQQDAWRYASGGGASQGDILGASGGNGLSYGSTVIHLMQNDGAVPGAGGGGTCYSAANSGGPFWHSGRGGDGMVIIQYLGTDL